MLLFRRKADGPIPDFEMRTISPGSISRRIGLLGRSNAQVSEATRSGEPPVWPVFGTGDGSAGIAHGVEFVGVRTRRERALD